MGRDDQKPETGELSLVANMKKPADGGFFHACGTFLFNLKTAVDHLYFYAGVAIDTCVFSATHLLGEPPARTP
jgi:hypothetical protein